MTTTYDADGNVTYRKVEDTTVPEQSPERERRGAGSGGQAASIEIGALPAERRSQPVQRPEHRAGLVALERRLPRGESGHATTLLDIIISAYRRRSPA